MDYLSREDILAANDLAVEVVEVPEWGGSVRVQALDALSGSRLARALAGADDELLRMRIVAATVIDDAGELLFSQADVEKLARKSWSAILRVSDAGLRLARQSDAAVETARQNF
jgi:hypothetical protein